MTDELIHYGTPRHSGRYPWGSGKDPYQNASGFLSYVSELKKQGMTESAIAKATGLKSTSELRAMISIGNEQKKAEMITSVYQMKKKQMSNVAIAQRLGISEGSVRNYLKGPEADAATVTRNIADQIKAKVDSGAYVDVGRGVENHLGVSPERLKTAVAMLEAEGYKLHNVYQQQIGTGEKTTIKVLAKGDTPYKEITNNRTNIQNVMSFSEDQGRTFEQLQPPKKVSADRVVVRYAEQGGGAEDGVIYLRPGVEDISLGGKQYAQVRIAVGDSHYLKGMAIYSDNIPKGADIVFNTDKSDTGNKLDAMKPVGSDEINPFESTYTQRHYTTKDGKRELSALNIVNEEGDWATWSKRVSSQMLSKQQPALAREQLGITQTLKKEELDDLKALTNPTVKRKLLESYADGADAAAVELKAAAMPRSSNHVILPVNSLKPTEVYAPNYKNGESVALIRHPHGGIFEIPVLQVNNRHAEARKIIGTKSPDAIGINAEVAHQLSGADFDGDTVLVIPLAHRRIKSAPPLEGLKDFDPKREYAGYPGMKVMSNTQTEMGKISNLITDMSVQGANESEIARAVRHSMVVIDAEKHKLNYKLSEDKNGIRALKAKYQKKDDGRVGGSSTLISRAKSAVRIEEVRPRRASEGGPIDPKTGEVVMVPTGATYVDSKTGKTVPRTTKTTQMALARDAHTLSTGTPIEKVYADHANKMKALANEARKELIATPRLKQDPAAKKAYAAEVKSLNAQLDRARKNAPLERQAQIHANAQVRAKSADNPHWDKDDLKRERNLALRNARSMVGANKTLVKFTDREWEAIQAGAISDTMLSDLLNNADLDRVKELATPRSTTTALSPARLGRAKALVNQGYTLAEVAEMIGVSASTISKALS